MVADGPRSPLVAAYSLVIAVAALRFRLRLVWFATLGSMAGYLVLLGYARWFAGRDESLFGPRDLSVPRYQQLIVLFALALLGIVLGQMIRRVRALAEDYARRLQSVKEKTVV
jgi:O-antigen ligase